MSSLQLQYLIKVLQVLESRQPRHDLEQDDADGAQWFIAHPDQLVQVGDEVREENPVPLRQLRTLLHKRLTHHDE